MIGNTWMNNSYEMRIMSHTFTPANGSYTSLRRGLNIYIHWLSWLLTNIKNIYHHFLHNLLNSKKGNKYLAPGLALTCRRWDSGSWWYLQKERLTYHTVSPHHQHVFLVKGSELLGVALSKSFRAIGGSWGNRHDWAGLPPSRLTTKVLYYQESLDRSLVWALMYQD